MPARPALTDGGGRLAGERDRVGARADGVGDEKAGEGARAAKHGEEKAAPRRKGAARGGGVIRCSLRLGGRFWLVLQSGQQ